MDVGQCFCSSLYAQNFLARAVGKGLGDAVEEAAAVGRHGDLGEAVWDGAAGNALFLLGLLAGLVCVVWVGCLDCDGAFACACVCAPWLWGGMPLHGGCVMDVPAAGMFGFAGWWCELGPELVDLVVDGGEDGVEVEVSCRCGGEPPRGDLAPDLFPGDVGVGECWLAADELFDCVLVPGAGCLVKLPCPGFLGAGFSGDPGSKSSGASGQAPFVAFVKESLDVVVCCVCWLPFLPRRLDWGEGMVPVDGFNEDALLAGPAQDGVWRVGLAKRADPDEADDAFVGALYVLLPAPRVWLLPRWWGAFGSSLPMLCGGVPVL